MAAATCISLPPPLPLSLSSAKRDARNSLSWSTSFPNIKLSANSLIPSSSTLTPKQGFVVRAAWTRRSRSEAAKRPNRKSWKQRTDMYMRPFLLNVFFSKRFIHAKVMHRGTSKVVSVATTNARDLRNALPSLTDNNACRVIGNLIAERSKEADVYAVAFEPDKNVRIEGRLAIILDTIQENGNLIAERSKEADVYAVAFEPDKNVRIEGRLAIILDTIQENGILFV